MIVSVLHGNIAIHMLSIIHNRLGMWARLYGTILASAAQNQASAAAMTRRESFDEEILGLPGLDGLDDEDLDAAFDESMRNG